MAFKDWLAAILAHRLAMGDAHAADLQLIGLRQKLPEQLPRLFHRHAMQIDGALKGYLSGLELAQLAFLHTIGGPAELLLGMYVDHELVRQPVNAQAIISSHGALAQRLQ